MCLDAISRKHNSVAILMALLCACAAASADWAQFQGPGRNGVSPEKGLARTWPRQGPKVVWTIPLGEGFAGPAIRDGEVYLLDRLEGEADILRCIALDTGEERWRYTYEARGRTSHNGSRTTPTVTENHVFTVGLLGDFYCFDRKTHKPVWSKNLLKDFGPSKKPNWGFSQSPSLYQDLVIVAPQSPAAFVAAYKQATGELVWTTESLGRQGYVSPLVTNLCGVDQVVMVSSPKKGNDGGPGKVAGISLVHGGVLWQYEGWQCSIPITFPTPLPDNRLFITGGYGAGSAMIQIKRSGTRFEAVELFTTGACGSQIHQPLLYEGRLYANSNANGRKDGMICLALDGEVLWRTKDADGLPLFERGSLILADGMIIALDGKTGILHLVEPSPKGFKELAKAKIFVSSKMWSPMALSNGKLVLRSQEEMKCLDLLAP